MHALHASFNDIFDHTDPMGPKSEGISGGPQHEIEVSCFDSMWPVLDNCLSPPVGINTTPSINEAFNNNSHTQPFSPSHLWNKYCDLLAIDHNFGALTDIGYATSAESIPDIIGVQPNSAQILGGMHSLQE